MIEIKEEFKKLIPALTAEEFKQLEENILKDGIRDPLVLWNGYLIDGHNRYQIAFKHGLEYNTIDKEFKDESEVKEWMINNQFGRRNLSNYQRSVLALELESVFSQRAKEQQIEGGKNKVVQISEQAPMERKAITQIAKVANVSHDTIAKVKLIQAQATPEVKAQLSTGEVSINQVYQDIKKEEKQEVIREKKKEYEQRIEKVSNNQFKVDIFNTINKFRVIYADPAWSYNDKQDTPQLGGAAKHYDTMSVSEICSLPVNEISEKDSVLFLWTTHAFLRDAFDILDRWGLTYKATMVWDKQKMGMGRTIRLQCEFCLFAIKGRPYWENTKHRDIIKSKHGVKDAFIAAYNVGKRITVQEALMVSKQSWFKETN